MNSMKKGPQKPRLLYIQLKNKEGTQDLVLSSQNLQKAYLDSQAMIDEKQYKVV